MRLLENHGLHMLNGARLMVSDSVHLVYEIFQHEFYQAT